MYNSLFREAVWIKEHEHMKPERGPKADAQQRKVRKVMPTRRKRELEKGEERCDLGCHSNVWNAVHTFFFQSHFIWRKGLKSWGSFCLRTGFLAREMIN